MSFGVNKAYPTKIETELEIAGTKYKLNQGSLRNTTANFDVNMDAFMAYIRDLPIVQSEIKLYNCISQDD